MRNLPGTVLVLAVVSGAVLGSSGCATEATAQDAAQAAFTTGTKNLFPPELFDKELVVAVGQPLEEPIAQPIAFPHDRHVQVLGMDCQYCHSGARKGVHAGVPSTQLCMGCHNLVPTEGRPELDKLKDFYARNEPIPWVKVHDLPDFVYFSHKRHVLGGVQCQECHGQVQEMGVAERVATLEMGWCLDCHAQHDKIDENYGTKAELRRAELKDCYTCHK
ncbi:MAG: cytochrome c3 family protein [Pseudomonadota bacterium]|nr:cytochrome c3 family protein [Pseudomonadota bacterium]